ncbi:MAG: hypothetical protein QMD14_00145 [Candidatus Aenigmarchaeota archaeon]|nr:hypothetical protein [Candidatus Aenigmarchaeota archaeon]
MHNYKWEKLDSEFAVSYTGYKNGKVIARVVAYKNEFGNIDPETIYYTCDTNEFEELLRPEVLGMEEEMKAELRKAKGEKSYLVDDLE